MAARVSVTRASRPNKCPILETYFIFSLRESANNSLMSDGRIIGIRAVKGEDSEAS
jgi:hypothetical protein